LIIRETKKKKTNRRTVIKIIKKAFALLLEKSLIIFLLLFIFFCFISRPRAKNHNYQNRQKPRQPKSLGFGDNKKIDIAATNAKITVDGKDLFSGSFSFSYTDKNLLKFSLDAKGSYANLDNSRITNNDGEQKVFFTQYNSEGVIIKEIWHNKALSSTYTNYLDFLSRNSDNSGLRALEKRIDDDIKNYQKTKYFRPDLEPKHQNV
jgi:hypothetical protein